MHKGVFKEIIFQVFDVLELPDAERNKMLTILKSRLALKLLENVKDDLPKEEQEWIDKNSGTAQAGDPEIEKIQKTISALYPQDAIYEKSKPLFKEVLQEYIDTVTQSVGLSFEKTNKLKTIADGFQ